MITVGGFLIWRALVGADQTVYAVDVAEVRQQQLSQELAALGTIAIEDIHHVTARIAAPVKQVPVKVGDRVKVGQLLVQLEVSDYLSAVSRYQAQVNAAQAELALARAGAWPQEIAIMEASRRQAQAAKEQVQQNLQRLEKLLAAGAIPLPEVEKLRLELSVLQEDITKLDKQLEQVRQGARPEEIQALEAQVEEALAGLARAEQQVSYGQVNSPVAGYVLTKGVAPGQMLPAGRTMFTVGDSNNLVVEAEVSERYLWAIQTGQQVKITGDGFRGRDYQGQVARIALVAEENLLQNEESRYQITIALPDAEWQNVRPGMNVKMHFTAVSPRALVIPLDALVEKETITGAETVWVVDEGKIRYREIQLGLKTEQVVEVVSGLYAGEQVVLSPVVDLTAGARVNVQVRSTLENSKKAPNTPSP